MSLLNVLNLYHRILTQGQSITIMKGHKITERSVIDMMNTHDDKYNSSNVLRGPRMTGRGHSMYDDGKHSPP